MKQNGKAGSIRTEGEITCPNCSGMIPVGIMNLFAGGVKCPRCGLSLTVDKKESARALEAARMLLDAAERLEKESVFRK